MGYGKLCLLQSSDEARKMEMTHEKKALTLKEVTKFWEIGTDCVCPPKESLNLNQVSQEQMGSLLPNDLQWSLYSYPSILSQTKLEAGVDPEQKTQWVVCVEYLSPRQLICSQEARKEPKAWGKPRAICIRKPQAFTPHPQWFKSKLLWCLGSTKPSFLRLH